MTDHINPRLLCQLVNLGQLIRDPSLRSEFTADDWLHPEIRELFAAITSGNGADENNAALEAYFCKFGVAPWRPYGCSDPDRPLQGYADSDPQDPGHSVAHAEEIAGRPDNVRDAVIHAQKRQALESRVAAEAAKLLARCRTGTCKLEEMTAALAELTDLANTELTTPREAD